MNGETATEFDKSEFDADFEVGQHNDLTSEPAQACYIDPWTHDCTYIP